MSVIGWVLKKNSLRWRFCASDLLKKCSQGRQWGSGETRQGYERSSAKQSPSLSLILQGVLEMKLYLRVHATSRELGFPILASYWLRALGQRVWVDVNSQEFPVLCVWRMVSHLLYAVRSQRTLKPGEEFIDKVEGVRALWAYKWQYLLQWKNILIGQLSSGITQNTWIYSQPRMEYQLIFPDLLKEYDLKLSESDLILKAWSRKRTPRDCLRFLSSNRHSVLHYFTRQRTEINLVILVHINVGPLRITFTM